MKRTPLLRRTPLQGGKPLERGGRIERRTPLRQFGKKARRDAAELRKAKKVIVERSGGRCEARVDGVCWKLGRQAHHILRRSQGGSNHPSNLLWICDRCHDWIHHFPLSAFALGLLRSSAVTVRDTRAAGQQHTYRPSGDARPASARGVNGDASCGPEGPAAAALRAPRSAA